MPYKFDYQQYKKNISSTKSSVVPILCVVIIILLGLAFFLKTSKPNIINFYYVEIANFESYKDANELAQNIQNSGGAGYVYLDKNYHVLANFYKNKDQAENVVKNLKNTYSKCCLYTISTNKFLKNSKFSNNQNSSITSFISICEKSLISLAGLSIVYDKNEINFARIKTDIKEMQTKIKNCQSSFAQNFKPNLQFNTAKEYSLEISKIFDFLSNAEEQNFSSVLKYQMVKLSINLSCFSNAFA